MLQIGGTENRSLLTVSQQLDCFIREAQPSGWVQKNNPAAQVQKMYPAPGLKNIKNNLIKWPHRLKLAFGLKNNPATWVKKY